MRGLSRLIGSLMMCAVAAASPAIAGIRVQPMSYDLTPSGTSARQDIRVENTGSSPTAVEITVERRQILPDGQEKRTPADDDFLIFPPQGIVPANGFQTFRVQYIADPAIERTAIYVVTVAQLPVDTTGGEQSGVQLLFNLGTLAAVSPKNSKPKLVVTNVAQADEPGNLQISVSNEGNRYARLRSGKWTFTSADGKKETLEGEALSAAIAQPLIEPGTTRIVQLPVSPEFNRIGAKAEFELTETAR